MLQSVVLSLLVAVLAYVALKRCAGILLSAAAQNKHFKLSVETVGPLIVKGVHLQLSKGPIADVRISEVSLGHTRNASKTAKAALSWQFRLPFTIRDLVIDLRQPADHSSATASKPGAIKTSSRGTTSLTSHKALLNTGLRLLLGILPNIPIRVKQLTLRQAGIGYVDVPRVEVFINSSRLSSKLKVDVRLLPIRALLQSQLGADYSEDDVKLLDLQHFTSSVVLQVTSQTMGLHCTSASVDVGPVVVTCTQALLSAVAMLARTSKKIKAMPAANRQSAKAARTLSSSTFKQLVAVLPDEVCLTVPSVCIQAQLSSSSQLTGSIENRNFRVHASRQPSKAPAFDTPPAAAEGPSPNDDSMAAKQLYRVCVTSGGTHASVGISDAVPAVTVSINSLTTEVSLSSNLVPSVGQAVTGQEDQPPSAQIHASLTLQDPTGQCCYDTLWHAVAAVQQQQQTLLPVPDAPSLTGQLSSAPQADIVPLETTMSGGEVASMTAQEGTIPSIDFGQAYTSHQGIPQTHASSNNSNQLQAVQPAESVRHQNTMKVQCILQAQTAGVATFDVVAGNGITQAACSIDVMSATVTLKPGERAGRATDLSMQAAMKGCSLKLLPQSNESSRQSSSEQMQQIVALQDLYVAGGAEHHNDELICKGSMNLAGLNIMLAQTVLLDTLTLAMHAQPPSGLFGHTAKRRHPPNVSSIDPSTALLYEAKKKPSRKLQLAEVSFGMSNVGLVYQTTVTVPESDRPGDGPLTLACTERISVQDVTAEVHAVDMHAFLQIEGLAISHQELPLKSNKPMSSAAAQSMQLLCVAQCSMQAGKADDRQDAQRRTSGRLSFKTQRADAWSPASSPASVCARPPAMAAAVQMHGTTFVFHADAVLALCKAAGDVAALMQQAQAMAGQLQPEMMSSPAAPASDSQQAPGSSSSALHPFDGSLPTVPSAQKVKRAKPTTFPRVHLHLQITQLQADFAVAEHITWGLSLPSVQCHLDSSIFVALLQQQQITGQHGQHTQPYQSEIAVQQEPDTQPHQTTVPLQERLDPMRLPYQASGLSAGQPNQADGLTPLRPTKAGDVPAECPRLQLKEAAVTLNSKLLLFCGVMDANIDFFPGQAKTGGPLTKPLHPDWQLTQEQHAAAYSRAGLHVWAAHCRSLPNPVSLADTPTLQPAVAPAAVAEVAVSDVRLNLPHDQDFGRAERFVELWAKAFEKSLKGYLQELKKPQAAAPKPAHKAAARDIQALLLPLEVRLSLRGATVKFEHHPMEAWFAVHGPMLRGMAGQDALWTRVVAADSPSPDDPILEHSGSQSFGSEQYVQEFSSEDKSKMLLEQANLNALAVERGRQYLAVCEQLQMESQSHSSQGALMHVAAGDVTARVVLLPTDAASVAAAMEFMAEVDPPSQGVPMRQVQKLHVDVSINEVVIKFCGNSKPLAQASSAQFSGAIAVGRQVTATPLLYSRRMPVGKYRQTEIGVTVKGSRALVKVYTDVRLVVDQAQACYGSGLEPTIAMVSAAGKRLSPTEPDKSRPKPATLPWFDMMRFTWRGGINISATNFEFNLATGIKPDVTASTERLQVQAAAATVQLAYEGKLVVSTTGLTAQAFKAAGLDQPAGTMYALPLLDFPYGHYVMSAKWHMLHGHSKDDHHLFPVPVPEGPDARQGPMLPADHYRTEAVDVNLQITVGNHSGVMSGAQQQGGLPAADSAVVEDGSAILFLGDHQVVFIKEMIAVLARPPLWLKAPLRHGTYYLPVDRKRIPTKNLPKLFDHFDISAWAGPLDVVHYTVDREDPSDGLCLSMTSGAWQGNMLMNQPNPQPARHGASAAEKHRQAARVRTKMLSMVVEAKNVQLSAGDSEEDAVEAEAETQDKLLQLMADGNQSATRQLQTQPSLRRLLTAPQSSDNFILSIASVNVVQAAVEPGSPQNGPTKVQINNCQLLVDLSTRNAVWLAAVHLFHAFRPMPAVPEKATLAPGLHARPPLTGSPSTRSMRVRNKSSRVLKPQNSFGQQGGDLLAILHQQNQQAAEDDQDESEDDSLLEQDMDTEPEPTQTHLSADPGSAQEPVAQADAHLVGLADGTPTEGHDAELQDALAAETKNKEREQAAQADKARVEDSQSRLTFEVEVVHFQAYLQAELVPGRFLLAAERGRVEGRHAAHLGQNVTMVDLEQVQAHVAQTDVDPGAAVAWLRITDDGLQASPVSTQLMRRVFDPFKVQLRISKSTHPGHPNSPGKGRAAGAGPVPATGQGQEIRLMMPQIGALMDSREFEVLTDVISNVGMAQGPHATSLTQDQRLLVSDPLGESGDVQAARETFVYLWQYLHSLEYEAHEVRTRPQLLVRLPSRASSRPGSTNTSSRSLLPHLSRGFSYDCEDDQLPVSDVPTALHQYFQKLLRLHKDQANHDRLTVQGETLLAKWSEEQNIAAAQSMQAARGALLEVQAQAQKQKQNLTAQRFTLDLGSVRFHLCQDNGVLTQVRAPFIEASIVGVMLDSMKNKDLSGSSKLVIQRLDIRDTLGLVGEAPGLEPGMIVSAWNPDEGWARDALLRVNATKGIPTADLTVWELVDVMVHPLGVHIVQHVANSLWEYFFPKEDAAAKQRQQQWVKSVASRRKSVLVHEGSSSSNRGASGHSNASTTAAAEKAVAAVSASQPTSPSSPASPPFPHTGRRSRHRRISSWDQAIASKGRGTEAGVMSPANSGELNRPKSSGSVFRRPLQKRSASFEELSAQGWAGSGGSSKSTKAPAPKTVAKQPKLLFVHFQINRVHCRVTYTGAPFNIKDFKVLLDKQVYEGLEGRWVDLFNRMKWDIIKSVLKSVAGLQGRKFKELLPDHLLKEAKAAADKTKGGKVQWPFGWGKKKEADEEANPAPDPETLKARQKKRMMFGDQHLARFGSMTGKQGADVAQQLAVDEQEQQAQANPTAAASDHDTATRQVNSALSASQTDASSPVKQADASSAKQRGKAFMSKALANTTQGLKALAASRGSAGSSKQPHSQAIPSPGSPQPQLEGSRASSTDQAVTQIGEHGISNTTAQVQAQSSAQTRSVPIAAQSSSRSFGDIHGSARTAAQPDSAHDHASASAYSHTPEAARQTSTQPVYSHDSSGLMTSSSTQEPLPVHQSAFRREAGQDPSNQLWQSQHAQQAHFSDPHGTAESDQLEPSARTGQLGAQQPIQQQQQQLQPENQYQRQVSGNPFAQTAQSPEDPPAEVVPQSPFAAVPDSALQPYPYQERVHSPMTMHALSSGGAAVEALSSHGVPEPEGQALYRAGLDSHARSGEAQFNPSPSDADPGPFDAPHESGQSRQESYSRPEVGTVLASEALAGEGLPRTSPPGQPALGLSVASGSGTQDLGAAMGTASSLADMLGTLHHAGSQGKRITGNPFADDQDESEDALDIALRTQSSGVSNLSAAVPQAESTVSASFTTQQEQQQQQQWQQQEQLYMRDAGASQEGLLQQSGLNQSGPNILAAPTSLAQNATNAGMMPMMSSHSQPGIYVNTQSHSGQTSANIPANTSEQQLPLAWSSQEPAPSLYTISREVPGHQASPAQFLSRTVLQQDMAGDIASTAQLQEHAQPPSQMQDLPTAPVGDMRAESGSQALQLQTSEQLFPYPGNTRSLEQNKPGDVQPADAVLSLGQAAQPTPSAEPEVQALQALEVSHAQPAGQQVASFRAGLRPPPAPPGVTPGITQAPIPREAEAPYTGRLRPPPAPPGSDSDSTASRDIVPNQRNASLSKVDAAAPSGATAQAPLPRLAPSPVPAGTEQGTLTPETLQGPGSSPQHSLDAAQAAISEPLQDAAMQYHTQIEHQIRADSLQAAELQPSLRPSTQQQLNAEFVQRGQRPDTASALMAEQRQANADFAQSRQQPTVESTQLAEQQQSNVDFAQAASLQSMLGRSTPDAQEEALASEVSAQDRQKFMQSLQSPDKGSKTKGFTQGFTRMRAKAKGMLQSGTQAGVSGAPGSAADASASNTGLSKGSKMARDVTMMFGGLKRPSTE